MIENLLLVAFAFVALGGAVALLVARHPMRAALALVVTMLSLAGIYGLLGVHAIAVFQVLIYVSAVMVFMVYVIMLLDPADRSFRERFSSWLVPGIVVFALLAAGLGYSVWKGEPGALPEGAANFGVQPFSVAFLTEFWVHFELVSVLLVAAAVAAVAVIGAGRGRRG
jgi:NADH-quinone oxidoreductase subunit J